MGMALTVRTLIRCTRCVFMHVDKGKSGGLDGDYLDPQCERVLHRACGVRK
jgi:hypothetical protein